MRAVIVCGGDFDAALLPPREADGMLIAADSGLRHLEALGIVPDLCIGDWDSYGRVPDCCESISLQVRKDDTDLVAAARLAAARGANEMIFLGALGGRRFSHSLAAVQALGWLAAQGIRTEIRDRNCTVRALAPNMQWHFDAGTRGSLSVFALTERAVFRAEGLWYSGDAIEITSAFPLGVSNALTGAAASVTCRSGILAVTAEPEH